MGPMCLKLTVSDILGTAIRLKSDWQFLYLQNIFCCIDELHLTVIKSNLYIGHKHFLYRENGSEK